MNATVELPKMGRPAKPRAQATGFLGEPLSVGCVVIGLADVPCLGLVRNKAHRVTARKEGRLCPGGPVRWFYEIDGFGVTACLFDYFKVAEGVCNPTP